MNTDKLIKELELLADSCDSNYALEVNGYSQGVNDAIDLVKKLTIPVVVGQSEQLKMFQNMQYYMEHCQRKGYITPQDWLEKEKHF
ncbi:MAG: hypothetical protein ACJAVA_000326 [Flavobacteriaceae bacterium]|jgi:hypothetical protein